MCFWHLFVSRYAQVLSARSLSFRIVLNWMKFYKTFSIVIILTLMTVLLLLCAAKINPLFGWNRFRVWCKKAKVLDKLNESHGKIRLLLCNRIFIDVACAIQFKVCPCLYCSKHVFGAFVFEKIKPIQIFLLKIRDVN